MKRKTKNKRKNPLSHYLKSLTQANLFTSFKVIDKF